MGTVDIVVVIFLSICLYSLLNCIAALTMVSLMDIDKFRKLIKDRDILFFSFGFLLLLYNKYEDKMRERKRRKEIKRLREELERIHTKIEQLSTSVDYRDLLLGQRMRKEYVEKWIDDLLTEEEKEELKNKTDLPGKVRRMV